MPFLLHIPFDNSNRLEKVRGSHYFEYKGVRFKLIQNNPRKWSDVLLTIVPNFRSPETEKAYEAAGEFLSALGWENASRVALGNCRGISVGVDFQLRSARCRFFTFPEVPFSGNKVGYKLFRIPAIETKEQKVGLTLFREAHGANKNLLSFLLYWQILEISKEPVGWVNKTYYKYPQGLNIDKNYIKLLPLNRRKLGEYLLNDCRHAIAHIKRKPGGRVLRFDSGEENRRIMASTQVIRELARYYITHVLNVRKCLYLGREGQRGFPRYVTETELNSSHSSSTPLICS